MAAAVVLGCCALSAKGKSVKVFGARGDGKADDTEAFNKAFKASEGEVFVPPGRYRLTKAMMRAGLSLRGAGYKSVIVVPRTWSTH